MARQYRARQKKLKERKGLSFLNATIDDDGYVHSKNEQALKEKVLGSIGSASFNHGKSRPKQITVKLR